MIKIGTIIEASWNVEASRPTWRRAKDNHYIFYVLSFDFEQNMAKCISVDNLGNIDRDCCFYLSNLKNNQHWHYKVHEA